MKYLFSKESNYDKAPFIEIKNFKNECWIDWDSIFLEINNHIKSKNKSKIIVVAEFYIGVFEEIAHKFIKNLNIDYSFSTKKIFKKKEDIEKIVFPYVTDDEIFGFITELNISDFFDNSDLLNLKTHIESIPSGIIFIYGEGASLIFEYDILLYFDMPRWENQMRFRNNLVSNLGVENKYEKASIQYKRAFFVDWRVCDKLKKTLFEKIDYIFDTVDVKFPKMLTGNAYRKALDFAISRPLRLVPFFDPGPWGGQWMKEVCDLNKEVDNYAWCFDCVPEENSLCFKFGNIYFESPSSNLVFYKPLELLGKNIFEKFGDEFPIRFDFLDTIKGGNLSLQVHPLTEYIQKKFGMFYTQDESYYILDAGEDACVYLGLKENVDKIEMIKDLIQSQKTGYFDTEKYIEKWKAKKHDHFLIPAGTIHCSGANTMVLEISSTPYIFTFKLWDWGRMGLDGLPRPININHGKNVIQWNRTKSWTEKNLINRFEIVAEGDGWIEEKTGLHELEFIETRRHRFTKKVFHNTNGTVNVLNLVEGREIIVESENQEFEPYIIHFAETFIIPANISNYSIRPYGISEGNLCVTIKAYVR